MPRFPLPTRLLVALILAAALVPAAVSAKPQSFPMPDGSVRIADETHVAPFLAAWKAAGLKRARGFATSSTANQQAWDAKWYDLNLTFNPTGSTVTGTVRMKALVTAGPISAVDLDFYSNLTLDGVTSAGAATTSSRSGNLLTLNLGRAYATGEMVDVTVTYHGVPTAAGYFGFQKVYTRQLIWSLSEAYGARTWWPCKDAPEDKADSVDIHFTVPTGLTTVSNGTLLSTTTSGSWVTTNWRERYPIATYLVFIASYPYTVTTDWYRPAAGDSMPLKFNNYPESVAGYSAVQAKVKNMITAYASRMGEYPFLKEKYGHAQFQFGGGMEHQTTTCLGVSNEYVVCHELMHQWWGDLATCATFKHIWLNEGFATYGEALWAEANGGLASYTSYMLGNAYTGSGTIICADSTNENRVFDSNLSYSKASWVPHMLRHMMGDSLFFLGLRNYRTAYAYASPTTENFRDVMAATWGHNLDAFFQEWVYGEYYPVYKATWRGVASPSGGYDVVVGLSQTQAWQVFNQPVDLAVTTAAGTTTFVANDSLADQSFVIHVNAAPTGLQVDPGSWVLKSASVAAAGVAAADVPARALLEAARPNPSAGDAALRFALPAAGRARLVLLDVTGRRIRTLVDATLAAGPHESVWDGRDDAGAPAAAGLYWARLETAGGAAVTRRLVRVH